MPARPQSLPTTNFVPKCYCRECGNDDDCLHVRTADEAVDGVLHEYSSAVHFLVKAELQLELAHQLYRQSNFRLLRLSRRLKQGHHLMQYGRLKIGVVSTTEGKLNIYFPSCFHSDHPAK